MKKTGPILPMLILTLLCLSSCVPREHTYLASLDAAADYCLTVKYNARTYELKLSLSARDDTPRTMQAELTSPSELAGLIFSCREGKWTVHSNAVRELSVPIEQICSFSPIVKALSLFNASGVIGATLGGEYNEITTRDGVYYTDSSGAVREIYSNGMHIKLSQAEN